MKLLMLLKALKDYLKIMPSASILFSTNYICLMYSRDLHSFSSGFPCSFVAKPQGGSRSPRFSCCGFYMGSSAPAHPLQSVLGRPGLLVSGKAVIWRSDKWYLMRFCWLSFSVKCKKKKCQLLNNKYYKQTERSCLDDKTLCSICQLFYLPSF